MPITFLCKLLHGARIIDPTCTCTFFRISRESPLSGRFVGEGSIRIITLLPLELRGKEPRKFTLRFEHAFAPYVGKIEDVPIILIPDDLVPGRSADFKIDEQSF